MTRMPRFAFLLLLGSALAPGLAGCGVTPTLGKTPSAATSTASSRPTVPGIDVTALAKAKSSLSAQDYGTVSKSKNRATTALYQYQSLRNEWLNDPDDDDRDNYEEQMVQVLSLAGGGYSPLHEQRLLRLRQPESLPHGRQPAAAVPVPAQRVDAHL